MKNLKTFLLCVAGSWCVGAAAAEVRISTPVQILGAEAYCASWSAGVDANGDATLTCDTGLGVEWHLSRVQQYSGSANELE